MRIDSNSRAAEAQDLGQSSQSGARANAPAGGAGNALGSDTARLSTDQARVASLAAQVNNLPEVRQQKVEALRRVIGDGSYQVTPEQTADAILAEIQIPSAA